MKKFKFNLQAVLREREIREEEKKREMAVSIRALRKEEDILLNIEKQKEITFKDLSEEKMKSEPDIKKIRMFETYLMHLKISKNRQIDRIDKAKIEVIKSQNKLKEAMKRRKIISTLKEKASLKYYKEISKLELKAIDEFNVLNKKQEELEEILQ